MTRRQDTAPFVCAADARVVAQIGERIDPVAARRLARLLVSPHFEPDGPTWPEASEPGRAWQRAGER